LAAVLPSPHDHTHAARDVARGLAEVGSLFGYLKETAY